MVVCQFCNKEHNVYMFQISKLDKEKYIGCANCWSRLELYKYFPEFEIYKGISLGNKVWVNYIDNELKGIVTGIEILRTPKGLMYIYSCVVEQVLDKPPYIRIAKIKVVENDITYRNLSSKDLLGDYERGIEIIPVIDQKLFTDFV